MNKTVAPNVVMLFTDTQFPDRWTANLSYGTHGPVIKYKLYHYVQRGLCLWPLHRRAISSVSTINII